MHELLNPFTPQERLTGIVNSADVKHCVIASTSPVLLERCIELMQSYPEERLDEVQLPSDCPAAEDLLKEPGYASLTRRFLAALAELDASGELPTKISEASQNIDWVVIESALVTALAVDPQLISKVQSNSNDRQLPYF